MKYLLRVLFVLALFCGITSHARASEVDFHVQVLDPVCTVSSPVVCTVVDPSVPFPVTFTTTTCTLFFGGPPAPATNGCFEVINASPVSFTSLDITLTGFGSATFDCPTTGTSPASIFTSSSCGPGEDLSFFGGPGLAPTKTLAVVIQITDQGVADGLTIGEFAGTATINPTPEPDSLLLLSTGAMMMTAGLFLKRQRGFAFSKK